MSLTNPIGLANLKKVEELVKTATANLASYVKQDWPAITHFFLTSIELAARELDKTDLSNPDKKASLLLTVSQLYDTTVPTLLPIYLKPFNTQIKSFLLNTVLNVFVDYIVGKIHTLATSNNQQNQNKIDVSPTTPISALFYNGNSQTKEI